MVELIDFINKKKLYKKINSKKILNIFIKCIIKSISELDIKFKTIQNKKKTILDGINMVYNVFIILILFLKILYTSLTNNKIKTNETDELIYDDYAFEFDEDSCKISNGNKEKCGKNKNCKYDDGTNLCTFDESSCEKSNGNKEECVKHCKYDDVTSSCTFH